MEFTIEEYRLAFNLGVSDSKMGLPYDVNRMQALGLQAAYFDGYYADYSGTGISWITAGSTATVTSKFDGEYKMKDVKTLGDEARMIANEAARRLKGMEKQDAEYVAEAIKAAARQGEFSTKLELGCLLHSSGPKYQALLKWLNEQHVVVKEEMNKTMLYWG